MKQLLEKGENSIFSFDNDKSRNNPYASNVNPLQFTIPIDIDDGATDDHGQITAEYLDQIFTYVDVPVGTILGLTSAADNFTTEMKGYLAQAYYFVDVIDQIIEFFDRCPFPSLIEAVCSAIKARFVKIAEDYNPKFQSTSLDSSISLLFGNGTTIGQVCSFAKGLEENTVQDLPGWCCLDAPYQSKIWGEKVRKSATFCKGVFIPTSTSN